ncbi:PD40 domain-containing protein [Plantactinospora sp. BB1]|uniref:TolB family protein n=1 Tax=Plantactinospora sp. BB1 TaxID=2071627 RepID=UPI00131ED7D6|nr:PD40 domain-containing protein [Plantactinospora sp. BB1]
MSGLRDMFDEIAGQAKVYDVTGRAVRVARRRRRAARLAPVAAAATVVTFGTVAVVGLRPDPPVAQTVVAVPTVDWLPDRLDLPASGPDALPASGPVGPGVLVYADLRPGAPAPVLLTEDGRQHRLAEPVTSAAGLSHTRPTLSPDGRWLGEQRDGRYVVRDLTGTTRHRLPDGFSPVAWSPESRWLLLADNLHEEAAPVRLDVTSGDQRPVTGLDGERWQPLAVLPGDEVLFLGTSDEPVRRTDVDLRQLEVVGGTEPTRLQLNLRRHLGSAESLGSETPRVSPDGRALLFSVVEVADPEQGMPGLDHGGDLIRVDLTSKGVRRIPLPHSDRPGPAAASPSPAAARDWWTEPLGYLPEGVLLRLRTADGQGDALQVLDPATGAVNTVTELPARARAAEFVWPRGS